MSRAKQHADYHRAYYHRNQKRIRQLRKRIYYAEHTRIRETAKRSRLRRKYGLTAERFQAMWDSQHGKCANPGCRETLEQTHRGFAIDHCHKAGHVRGILCQPCNTAVGMLRNSSRRAHGLATYLTREIIFNGE